MQALTFHAAARRQLHYFWPRVVGDTGWQLLDTKFAVVAQAANRARLQVSTEDVRDLAGEIEWAKASLISPEGYRRRGGRGRAATSRWTPTKVAAVYAGYEKLKANRDGIALLDFDDLLLHTAAAIENDAGGGRGVPRTATAASSSTSTRTSPRCSSGCSTPGSATATTSPSSATPTRPSTRSPAPRRATCSTSPAASPTPTVVRLERDYRSTPQVVSLANQVIAAARGRMAGSKLHLVGQRDPGPAPTFHEHPDEVAEAAAVAALDQGPHRIRHARSAKSRCSTASTRSPRSTRRR